MIRRPEGPHVLVVDLNNFARFPTLPVGLIVAVLRGAGLTVEVLSPLAVGVNGVSRGDRARPWGMLDERLRWWSATTPSRTVRGVRAALGRLRIHERSARGNRLITAIRLALDRRPRAVLVSAYLMYHETVRHLCALAAERSVPVILGGPAFHEEETRREWLRIPGLTAIYAGEAEGVITRLLTTLSGTESIPGLTRRDKPDGGVAPPLVELDDLPFPDYDDYPWDLYPNRVVSMMTGRGCGWGVCRFCSDVVTVSGRTFRTRSVGNVLGELAHHHGKYKASLFCFSDLKLNSDLEVWRGLYDGFQHAVPGAKWTCAVHAGPRSDEGLSQADLKAARRAGLVRITTGFETGSQRLLSAMRKGTTPQRVACFLAAAHEAGISTRVTAFTGYPGEEPGDVEETTRFLAQAGRHLDRVHLSRLVVQGGTPLEHDLRSGRLGGTIHGLEPNPLVAETAHLNSALKSSHGRKAIRGLLRAVHEINRRPLPDHARELAGVM